MKPTFDQEMKYWHQGFDYVAGVDEAGRGPLAGPVVACAVILPKHFYHPDINDSKQLSKAKRIRLKAFIETHALYIGTGIVHQEIIDQINILEAARYAMMAAIKDLGIVPGFVLTDHMRLDGIPHESITKGDQVSISIAAASIVAKVTRDELMLKYDAIYPMYGFKNHQGYGTKQHLEALAKYGPSPIHRKSFKPVQKVVLDT